MFYARNSFRATIEHRQFSRLRTWLDLVGPSNLRLVRSLDVVVRESEPLMTLAMKTVVDVLGMTGVRFRLRTKSLGYVKQPGRREKGHGRYKKNGWKG